MDRKILIESVLHLTSQISFKVKDLIRMFQLMLDLIEREHRIIEKSKVDLLEEIVGEKISLGNSIQERTLDLQSDFNSLRGIYSKVKSEEVPYKRNLSEVIKMLKDIYQELDDKSLKSVILSQGLKELEIGLEKFLSLHKEATPKIKMNTFIVGKLLAQHREVWNYWQKIANEASSVYGSSGEVENSHKNSTMLQIKA